MKKLIALLIILISSYSQALCMEDGTFAIEHHTNREEITYKLPITTEFQQAFLGSLKTGNLVKVVHKVKIRPVDRWFGWLSEKNYTKYYKYNTINNQYYVGVKKDRLNTISSKEKLLKNVTALNNAPFLPKKVLHKGNAYEIDFTITINPTDDDSSSTNLLLFKGNSLKERLHSAVHYIDK